MSALLADDTLDRLFRDGRSFNGFLDKVVTDETLKTLAELVILGPTEANTLPGRFVFVKSPEAKEKLLAAMAPGNQAKTKTAPVSVIVGYDLDFYENLPKTFPHADARSWYAGSPDERLQFSALRSASLQAGYLTTAARALGLDVGPMAGFDAATLDAAFFPNSRVRTFLVVNLGYGDKASLFPRLPRLSFDEYARIV
ncbi:malonic semialdehyde reductase [Pleomorphomonas sp. PLEO]|uniref:malonic semialdehyde reductase n=1 Tax=Pleomorphomonas sp. PLEO TaxID=3239306 RepID=UPI00351F0B76